MAYGPGPDYKINTQQSYSVRTEFWSDRMASGQRTALTNIQTILTQGDREVVLEQACEDCLNSLTNDLESQMSMALSYVPLGANEIGDSCSADACADSSNISIENVAWTAGDSENWPWVPTPVPEGIDALMTTCSGEFKEFYVRS